MKEKPQLYSHAVAYFHCKTITSFTLHNLLHTSNRLPNLQIQKIMIFIVLLLNIVSHCYIKWILVFILLTCSWVGQTTKFDNLIRIYNTVKWYTMKWFCQEKICLSINFCVCFLFPQNLHDYHAVKHFCICLGTPFRRFTLLLLLLKVTYICKLNKCNMSL